MTKIYLSSPDIGPREFEFVADAMRSNWIAPTGPDLEAFEDELCATTTTEHAIGLSSATAALHLALVHLGVGPGDVVMVSTFTFAASVFAISYTGATPLLIDSDSSTWQISPDLVEEELRIRSRRGTLPKAAIIVDLYGQCADYGRLVPLLEQYEIPIIEDAAEALGATYSGQSAGSFGRCGVISFNGNKIITTGGGGALVTNDSSLGSHIRHLANQAKESTIHYEHNEVGFNYRLSNILAALGRAQLLTLETKIKRRQNINALYRDAFKDVSSISFMPIAGYGTPNWWMSCIEIDHSERRVTRDIVRIALGEHDIESRPLWNPMHHQPIFRDAPARIDGTSSQLFANGLCLPSGSGLTDSEIDYVCDVVLTCFE